MQTIKYILLFFLLIATLHAQNSVIKNLQTKFNSINTLSADFSQSSKMNGTDKSLSLKGKIFYQKDDKYRIELKNQELISDGTTYWSYNKRSNKVVINDLQNEKSAFSFKNIVDEYPAKCKVESSGQETLGGEKLDVIKLIPKKASENFSLIRLWSDGNNLIRKVEITDNAGLVNIFEFSNIKVNPVIPGNKFNFEPPKGSEVVDLR